MPEIPPDDSIVAIQSYRYGTYLAACSDHKSVSLQKVDDSNNLPENCLWTLHTKPLLGYAIGSLRFVSCYGRHLAVTGYFFKEVSQDNPLMGYNKFGYTGWTPDRVGTTDEHEGYRLMVSLSGLYLRAGENGKVGLDYNPFYLCTKPEVYWKIHHIGRNNGSNHVAPARPRGLGPCSVKEKDEDEGCKIRYGKNTTFIIKNELPYYNRSTVYDSGGCINVGGHQSSEGIKAGNKIEVVRRLENGYVSSNGTETR